MIKIFVKILAVLSITSSIILISSPTVSASNLNLGSQISTSAFQAPLETRCPGVQGEEGLAQCLTQIANEEGVDVGGQCQSDFNGIKNCIEELESEGVLGIIGNTVFLNDAGNDAGNGNASNGVSSPPAIGDCQNDPGCEDSFKQFETQIGAWLRWIGAALGIGSFLVIAVMLMVSRRHRSQMAADYLTSGIWVISGLILLGLSTAITAAVLTAAKADSFSPGVEISYEQNFQGRNSDGESTSRSRIRPGTEPDVDFNGDASQPGGFERDLGVNG